jgi:FlaG/FlaF family flagellin (archaellin)
MASETHREDAVSPVIATILLIALTVTVIAVAALVVTNIAGGYGDQKVVDIRVTPSGEKTFSVMVIGGTDASQLTSLQALAEGVEFVNGGVIDDPQVGLLDELGISGSNVAGEVRLTLVGTFTDGTVQVVYSSLVTV